MEGCVKLFKYYIALQCIMENVCLRLDSALAKQIERDMKEFRYSTKTEFIRDAIRSKLRELAGEREKKNAWEALYAARGILKGKGKAKTDEEWYKLRYKAGEELLRYYDKKFGSTEK